MEFRNNTAIMYSYEMHWCEKQPYDWVIFDLFIIFITVFIILIALWGIIANVINLIVFSRIGILSDSSTVSLFGLAISDLIYCFAQLWTKSFGGISLLGVYYIGGASIYVVSDMFTPVIATFNQVTCFLTTCIAIERFVAIVFPFKVKYMFTSMKSLYTVCFCFVWNLAIHFDEFSGMFMLSVLKFENVTAEFVIASNITRTLNLSLRFITFIIIVICNATMLTSLSNRKFRKSSSSSKRMTASTFTDDSTVTDSKPTTINTATQLDTTDSSKPEIVKKKTKVDSDKRLMTMMAAICIMFIVCNFPHLVNVATFYIMLKGCHDMYRNTIHFSSYILELINSSCNIFFYYTMSTRYRLRFLSLFGKQYD